MDSTIPTTVPMDQLLALSGPEKIAVIGVLWDSVDDAVVAGPPPAWRLEELDRREAADRVAPEPTFSWDEARQIVKNLHAPARPA